MTVDLFHEPDVTGRRSNPWLIECGDGMPAPRAFRTEKEKAIPITQRVRISDTIRRTGKQDPVQGSLTPVESLEEATGDFLEVN
jgi:hypothetical protein